MKSHAAPPPGTNFLENIKPALNDIILDHTFTVILIPLLIFLFYFSTPQSRRSPIFILNVITIMLALTVGGLSIARAYRAILSPTNPPPRSWNLAVGAMGVFQSILVDTVLLFRLIAVFPKPYIGPTRFYLLITPPILIKLARIGNWVAFTVILTNATKDPRTAGSKLAQIWEKAPYLKIEWFCQLFDNCYASCFFLIRLGLRNRSQSKINSRSSQSPFTKKIKGLMYIAATNFVIPAIFSLVQIIIAFREVNTVIVNQIIYINTSIAVIGVVFATIWAGSGHHSDQRSQVSGTTARGSPGKVEFSTIMFAGNQMSSLGSPPRSFPELSSKATEEG